MGPSQSPVFDESVSSKQIPPSAQCDWEDPSANELRRAISPFRNLEVEAAMAQAAPQPTLFLQGLEEAAAEATLPFARPESPVKCGSRSSQTSSECHTECSPLSSPVSDRGSMSDGLTGG